LIKKFSSGKQTRIRNPYKMQILNLISPEMNNSKFDNLNINYDFYEIECYKLIYGIEHYQTDLFNG